MRDLATDMLRAWVMLVVVCALPVPSVAGARQSRASDDMDPVALQALYSLDFDIAESRFKRWTETEPENPTAWNMLASAIWLNVVYQQEKLNIDTFEGSRLGGSGSEDAITPEREAYLREVLGNAMAAAGKRLERDPDDIEALYAMGVSHGTTAILEALVKRELLKANGEAKKAREYHMRVLRLDPSYNDARLTIGTYDYTVGALPGLVRVLIGVIGIRGDKEGGIQQLEYAARYGENGGTNAKMVLVVAYNREREFDKSLSVLRHLHERYPRNFLLEISIASVFQRMEDRVRAIETYESILRKLRSAEDGYDRLDPEPVLFKIGEAYVHASRNAEALTRFAEVLASPNTSAELEARTRLWRGKIYDSQGRRNQAVAEYDRVLLLDCPDGIKDEARRYRRRAYQG